MRPVEFPENVPRGTRLILFSDDKPDRFCTVLEFKLDPQLGRAFPSYRVQDEEGRIDSLMYEPDEEECWLWPPVVTH
jgi:hypothetical protein